MMAVRALAATVEAMGVPRAQFLAEAEIAERDLEDPSGWVSLAEYTRARSVAQRTSGDPAFGLHCGERANVSSFDVLGYLAEHGSSLRETLQCIARYARIVMVDGPEITLSEEGELAVVRITQLGGEEAGVQFTAEFALVGLLGLLRRFFGPQIQLERAYFAYRAPAYRDEYTRIFAGREQFEHSFTGFSFDRAWLDRAPAYRSPELWSLLRLRAELLLARVEHDAPAADRVKRWLACQSLEARPTMDVTARGLGMSARSLRRRLGEEQARYDQLVEEALAARAKRMLAEAQHSVQETAYALGYGTPAAFSRAFKRWTGLAPSAFRPARS